MKKTLTLELFTLDELSEDARRNAYEDWRDGIGMYDVEDQLQMSIDYDARKALDPIISNWDCDGYGNIWPIMRNVEIPRDGHAPRMQHNGDCFTMDIADAFNAHGPQMEEFAGMWYQVAFPEHGTPFWECDDLISYDLEGMYEQLYLNEFERAARDALNKWEELREEEREYLTSVEAFEDEFNQGFECRTTDAMGRVYRHDSRKWYTIEGEFYEQSCISRECVSIVKKGA